MRTAPYPTSPDVPVLPIASVARSFSEVGLCDLLYSLTALDPLRPSNPVEAMLELHAVVRHHAAMELFHRADGADVSDALAIRLRKSAVAMMRAMIEATRALERLRLKPGTQARASVRQATLPAFVWNTLPFGPGADNDCKTTRKRATREVGADIGGTRGSDAATIPTQTSHGKPRNMPKHSRLCDPQPNKLTDGGRGLQLWLGAPMQAVERAEPEPELDVF
jgi:hypothetical protein